MTASHPGLKVGDGVAVRNEGLEELRRIMRSITGSEPKSNHRGTFAELWPAEDLVLIDFDDGVAATYPPADISLLR